MKTKAYGAAAVQGQWPVMEDAFYADSARSYYVLADGLGGAGLGDLAVKEAMLSAREMVQSGILANQQKKAEYAEWSLEEQRLCLLTEKLQSQIWNKNQSLAAQERAGFSLLAATLSVHGVLSLWNCGSCGAQLWRAGAFHPLLLPQNWELRGDILGLPRRALGLSANLHPEIKSLALVPGDIVLLFSSGMVFSNAVYDYLAAALSARAPGDSLQELAAHCLAGLGEGEALYNQSLLLVEA